MSEGERRLVRIAGPPRFLVVNASTGPERSDRDEVVVAVSEIRAVMPYQAHWPREDDSAVLVLNHALPNFVQNFGGEDGGPDLLHVWESVPEIVKLLGSVARVAQPVTRRVLK